MPCLDKSATLVWVLFVLALAGCGDATPVDRPLETQSHPQNEACEDPTLTWDNFGDGFVRNWCRGCHSPWLNEGERHGAPLGLDLATREDLQQHMDRVLARATGDLPTMPPGGGPSDEERRLLHTWLACGAP